MQDSPDGYDRHSNFARCGVGHYVAKKDIAVVRATKNLPDGGHWHGAYYDGIIKCNNWLCPVCGRQVARVRCDEIKRAGVSWVRSGGVLAMVTLTVRHSRGNSLEMLKTGLDEAMQRLRRNNSVGRILREAGHAGRIRSYEVQYGQSNGYHPHCHNLYFLRRTLTAGEVSILKRAWVSSVRSSGLSATWEVGLDYRDATSGIGDYLTKVNSISAEMSLGNVSKDDNVRDGHYSPLQLLALAGKGKSWAGEAYREEVLTMRGVHWVNWSKGLKARFGIAAFDDDEARRIGEELDRREEVAKLAGVDYMSTPWEWRGQLLDIVADCGLEGDFSSVGFRVADDGICKRFERAYANEEWPEDGAEASADTMPPSPLCRVDSPPLPYDSDIVPYPLSPLGNMGIIPRDTGQIPDDVL